MFFIFFTGAQMMHMGRTGVCAAVLLCMANTAIAQQPAQAGEIPFESYELENGLTVILAPDPASTAVAVNLWYDVGSRHERRGRSGFGHLFEHLMFQGSENVERGHHMQMVERAGGSLNASITEDRTNYFQTLPPDRYNLASGSSPTGCARSGSPTRTCAGRSRW
jgi:hypothetical protein